MRIFAFPVPKFKFLLPILATLSLSPSNANQIGSLPMAVAWYKFGLGNDAVATYKVNDSIKNGKAYRSKVQEYILDSVEKKLKNVSKQDKTGRLNTEKATVFGVKDKKTIVGSVLLNAQYVTIWKATDWKNNKRTITAEVLVVFSYEDRWDFNKNEDYTLWQNIVNEYGPRYLVGLGVPYTIYGQFSDYFSVSVTQRK